MSKAEFYFSGKAAWLGRKANAYGKYAFNLYPESAAERKAIKDTGIKNKVQEDDGKKSGLEGFFYILRSLEPFPITDEDGNEIEAMIGNGSEITVKLEVEKFDSPAHGPQARSRVLGVVVRKLVPYVKKEATASVEPALPA